MTIRSLSFRASLILIGAASTTSMAISEPERQDKILANQAQGSQFQDFQAPDALSGPIGQGRR